MAVAVTLAELLEVPTEDEILDAFIDEAESSGFPARSWQSGSVPRTVLEIEATTFAGLRENVSAIAGGGFLDSAEGDWLTLLASNVFDLDRVEAVKTQGTATLTAEATAGPYTIAARTLWISDSNDRRYVNVGGGTLSAGSTLDLTFEAEEGGVDYNVANGAITTMVTALSGVTVANPDPGTGTWITQSGADEEDDEPLRARCRARWSTLGTGSSVESYEYWAGVASDEVRQVSVREHDNLGTDTDGHVTVILAGDSGGVSTTAVSDVETYIEARRPLCVSLHVASATTAASSLTGTVYVAVAFSSTAQDEVATNLIALASEIGIGGTVYRSAITEAIMSAAGIVNVSLTTPAADADLSYNEVVSFTDSLTWIEV